MPLSRGDGSPFPSGLIHPALLTYVDLPSGEVREHTGQGTLAWDGEDWDGPGHFTGWEGPSEELGLASADAVVHYADTLDATRALLGTTTRGVSIRLWWGCTSTPGGTTFTFGPFLLGAGTLGERTFRLDRQGEDFAHDLAFGVNFGPWARAVASALHSYEAQKAAYPTDTAGRHLQNLAKKRINPPTWPGSD